jgi:hypothetical protein
MENEAADEAYGGDTYQATLLKRTKKIKKTYERRGARTYRLPTVRHNKAIKSPLPLANHLRPGDPETWYAS